MAAEPGTVSASPAPAATASAPPVPASAAPHRWRFYRAGGLDQVQLDTGADLERLADLDQKLWVALSCPVRGLELDPKTLELLDTDKDGRVRAPEVIAALKWCAARLTSLDSLVRGGAPLPLADLDPTKPEGKVLLGAARAVLQHLGKPEATAVLPEDVGDLTKVWEKTRFNGDGIIQAESSPDPALQKVITEAIACVGGLQDRSGKPGVDRKLLGVFFDELAKLDAWWKAGEALAPSILGDGTAAGWAALAAVREKVDDYFVRVRLAGIDPRAGAAMNRAEPELLALAAKDLGRQAAEVSGFPLAHVAAGRALPLFKDVNPAWSAALATLHRDVVAPVHGEARNTLTPEEWEILKARFLPWEAWLGKKAGQPVEPLGVPRAREILAAGKAPLEALLAEDEALAKEDAAVVDVVRMVHYHRDLYRLLQNFAAFADFYDPRRPAIFQAGTLYLDGRSCDLCIRVDDPGAHAGVAAGSRLFIAYCDCKRPGESMKIAACITQGDSDYLTVGRNGIFYDRKGRDWDATVVRVIDNPISLRQAFFAPYKKFVKLVEDQAAKFAAAKEKEADARVATAAEGTVGAATGQKAPPKADPVDVGKMVGIIAALGVGIGALGTVFGGLVSGFIGLQPWWAKLVAVGGMVLLISGPSVLVAWLKLRQRTLGPVLDANGWAVNGRVKVNIPLGTALTHAAVLPAGARRSLEDPYEDTRGRARRRTLWLLVVIVAVVLGVAKYHGAWPFGAWAWPWPWAK